MTRRTERICYLSLLFLFAGFVAYDCYERGFFPGLTRWPPSTRSGSLEKSAVAPFENMQALPPLAPLGMDEIGPPIDWIADDFRGSLVPISPRESERSEGGLGAPEETSGRVDHLNPRATPEEIQAFYDQVARRKMAPPRRDIRYHDWELAGGKKPAWMAAQAWNNRLRFENYKNPGPVYTSTHVDPFGNRHRSFEDRSGRLDVFETWGRERVYLTPK